MIRIAHAVCIKNYYLS